MGQRDFLILVAVILALICMARFLMAQWGYDDWSVLDGVLIIGCNIGSYFGTATLFDGAEYFFNADLSFHIFCSLVLCLCWILLIYLEKGLLMGKSGVILYIISFIFIWINVFSLTEDVYNQKEIQVAQEYISSGWDVYRDGEKLSSESAIKSINFENYEIEFDRDTETIYLIPY